jgi:hypothetical protein
VQQHDRRGVAVPSFSVEEPLSVDGGVAMVNLTLYD